MSAVHSDAEHLTETAAEHFPPPRYSSAFGGEGLAVTSAAAEGGSCCG